MVVHPNPEVIAGVLCTLKKVGLLSGVDAPDNRNAVAKYTDVRHAYGEGNKLSSVASVLKSLEIVGLLSGVDAQANFKAVVGHSSPYWLNKAIKMLNKENLLSSYDGASDGAQANFKAVVGHKNPEKRRPSSWRGCANLSRYCGSA